MAERGKRFRVTDAHLKLAREMNVCWENIEWGAPAIDGKRPYGNGDLYGDLMRILGLPMPEDGELPETLIDYLTQLHKSMETALQVFLSTGTFETGDYEASPYAADWKLAGRDARG